MAPIRCWADRFFGNQPRQDSFLLFGNNSLGDHCSCFIPLISSCWLVYQCIDQFWFLIEMITFSKVLHHNYKSKAVQFCRFSFLTEIEHHGKTFCVGLSFCCEKISLIAKLTISIAREAVVANICTTSLHRGVMELHFTITASAILHHQWLHKPRTIPLSTTPLYKHSTLWQFCTASNFALLQVTLLHQMLHQ